jgi:phage shock protein E
MIGLNRVDLICKITVTMYLSIFVGLLAGLVTYTFTGSNLVSPTRAKTLMQSGTINKVVDVRTRMEFQAGHFPGAVNIPVNDINRMTTARLPKRGLLVYCNTGQRARWATEKLLRLGFKDVYYIAGTYKSIS